MTLEKDNTDDAFKGIMKNLNIDYSLFKTYNTNFGELSLKELGTVKQEIEAQLNLLFDVLKTQYNANMQTPLLTPDGFPRNDVDVVGIRLVRVKIIRLRVEHKEVLTLLHEHLVSHFENQTVDDNTEMEVDTPSEPLKETHSIPFAAVQEVIEGSPAQVSGLKEGDKIILFDDVNVGNHKKLADVLLKVRTNIDKAIRVEILRGSKNLTLELTPTNNWNGQGLLGCKIIPL